MKTIRRKNTKEMGIQLSLFADQHTTVNEMGEKIEPTIFYLLAACFKQASFLAGILSSKLISDLTHIIEYLFIPTYSECDIYVAI